MSETARTTMAHTFAHLFSVDMQLTCSHVSNCRTRGSRWGAAVQRDAVYLVLQHVDAATGYKEAIDHVHEVYHPRIGNRTICACMYQEEIQGETCPPRSVSPCARRWRGGASWRDGRDLDQYTVQYTLILASTEARFVVQIVFFRALSSPAAAMLHM